MKKTIEKELVSIGELAELCGEKSWNIDFWTKENLLPFERAENNYRFYNPEECLPIIEKLKSLRPERDKLKLSSEEVRQQLGIPVFRYRNVMGTKGVITNRERKINEVAFANQQIKEIYGHSNQ